MLSAGLRSTEREGRALAVAAFALVTALPPTHVLASSTLNALD